MSVTTALPLIDLSSLNDHSLRSQTIKSIHMACKEIGFFQVINHGIPHSIAKDAIDTAMDFFDLSDEEKMSLASYDVYKPVRYGTNVTNHVREKALFHRSYLKHYSHPISKWIHLWPANPPNYREKMGRYAVAVQELQKLLMDIVLEGLGLNCNYLKEEIEGGMQVMAVNFYPPFLEPELTSGLAPHSDHGLLTILLQSYPGLQIKDGKGNWVKVPFTEGVLIILVGDQMEVLSNGVYKSVIHEATLNAKQKRVSIASINNFALEEKVRPAPMLVDEEHPSFYEECSFKDFLEFISSNGKLEGRFIDTLKKNNPLKEHA